MTQEYSDVFCDAVCVTYSPDDSPIGDCVKFLEDYGFHVTLITEDAILLHAGLHLSARLETKHSYHKVEVKGKALEHLRLSGAFEPFLGLLGSHNHKVTRLDLALDVPRDFPSVLHGIRTKFPDGYAKVSRKKGKITEMLEPRDSDGKRSGTLYFGSHGGKARKFARVYDKQLEALNRGENLPPTTRYEFVIREDVTLRDAACPAPCFWNFMGLELLQKPSDVPKWEKGSVYGWELERFEKLPTERLLRYIESSSALDRMVELADEIGPEGRNYLFSLLTRRLKSDSCLRT